MNANFANHSVPIEERFHIKKISTDPFLTYRQIDKYTKGAQCKAMAVLLHNHIYNGGTLPCNARLAWEANLDIGSIKNAKTQLCKMGLLSKRAVEKGNRTIWIYTFDPAWMREQYLRDFDAEFNNITREPTELDRELNALAMRLANAKESDEIITITKQINDVVARITKEEEAQGKSAEAGGDRLIVKRPSMHPYLTYPQLIRYLLGSEFKVAQCLIRYSAAGGTAFPSNKRIAWETNLKQGSVANIKTRLCKMGLLSKQVIRVGSTIRWLYTLDTEWRINQYKAEFDAKFNSVEVLSTSTPSQNSSQSTSPTKPVSASSSPTPVEIELNALASRLAKAASAEKIAIAKQIAALSLLIAQKKTAAPVAAKQPSATPHKAYQAPPNTSSPPTPQIVDDGLLDYIVEHSSGVKNWSAYKAKIRKLIVKGDFDGLENYRQGYEIKRTKEAIAYYLLKNAAQIEVDGIAHQYNGSEIHYNGEQGCYLTIFGGHPHLIGIASETVRRAIEAFNKRSTNG